MPTYQIIGILFALVTLITWGALVVERTRSKTLDPDYNHLTSILITLSRWMVGILFIYSGFVKANDYIGFGYKLEEYFLVFGQALPSLKGFFDFWVPLAEPLAWFISVFEIALAFALITAWRMNITAWLTLVMMVFFTILTGYSAVTGSVTDCGCFGDALKIEPWESFVKDIILTAMVLPIFLVRQYLHPWPNGRLASWITGLSFAVAGIYSYYCHENLPVIDYRAYKVGTDLNICTTTPEEMPKCKDWYPYFPEDEVPLFEGKVLMVIMYNAQKAPEEALLYTAELAENLKNSEITLVGATATGPSQMEGIIADLGLDYPMAYLDQTVLKTIVRSNPGYMLLNDGVVLKKWHHNNAPKATEIKAFFK